MTALLSLIATIYIAISLTRIIVNKDVTELECFVSTVVACELIWLINIAYKAGQP